MELAAAAEAVQFCTDVLDVVTMLLLSDYETWVKADLDLAAVDQFADFDKRRALWMSITDSLLDWMSRGGRSCWRVHTRSHKLELGHWGCNLNEVVDIVAATAKAWGLDGTLPLWSVDPNWVTFSQHLPLARPVTVSDVEYVVKKRESSSSDCTGLSNKLVKAAGPALWLALTDSINESLFRGVFYSDQPGGTLGRHSTVGKEDGGTRNLLIPDSVGIILSAIMANRLNIALMEAQALSLAQKCNIRGVSGVDENAFLFLACLFEFRNAAERGRLVDGQMRLFYLDDKKEAFDRAQFRVALHALDALLHSILPSSDLDQSDRFRHLALVLSYLTGIKIVVTADGKAAIVGKDGGVPQGGPDSGLLFLVLVEYLRRTIDPKHRPLISIRGKSSTFKIRVEIDYADDSLRTADSIGEAQSMVDALFSAMHGVDLQENPKKLRALGLVYFEATGIQVFDPRLKARGVDGRSKPIKAYGSNDWFKVNGLVTNARGETRGSALKASQRDTAVIDRISASDYPIGAKLEASVQWPTKVPSTCPTTVAFQPSSQKNWTLWSESRFGRSWGLTCQTPTLEENSSSPFGPTDMRFCTSARVSRGCVRRTPG